MDHWRTVVSDAELRAAISEILREEEGVAGEPDRTPSGDEAAFGVDGCPPDQGTLFDPAAYDPDLDDIPWDAFWVELSPVQLDPFEILDFVNTVRRIRQLDPLTVLSVRGAARADSMNCFLARLVDCDVPNDRALEMQTTAEARALADMIGETTDHEWVHLPPYMTEAIRRFDAGSLAFDELRLPQPGQLRLSVHEDS